MNNIRSFDNAESMFNWLDEQNKIGREYTDSINGYNLIEDNKYWLVVLDTPVLVIGERMKAYLDESEYDDKEEYEFEKRNSEESQANGYIFGKWYSVACLYGELGSNHLSKCIPIDSTTFHMILEKLREKF